MNKILVALDGTPGSEKALEAAVRLAQRDGSQLAAVAVFDRPGDPWLDQLAVGVQALRRRRLGELPQAATNFARSHGVHRTPLFREGHPAEAILTCAEQQGADLVVLGGRGRSVAAPGLGGTADQVTATTAPVR
jgi:nucleotide-binding universal stress UspA family protein